MLERPDIPEEFIGKRIKAEYGLEVRAVTFLPLGYDVHTAVYQVDTPGDSYFLKLRTKEFKKFMVALPHYLRQMGIQTVIDPFVTASGELYAELEQGEVILYPFIPGKNGYEVEMTEQQWVQLGETLRMVHQVILPNDLRKMLPSESFDPAWRELTRQFMVEVTQRDYADVVAQKLAEFMRGKRGDILGMVDRADELVDRIRNQALEYVLCHADCHLGNFHIGEDSKVYLVDWDNPLFAPRERDLMFFGDGMMGDISNDRNERWFYHGYGKARINLEAKVYYRYERIIQDIAEFCKQLLLTDAGGDDREQAYKFFTSNFAPGGELEAARRLDERLNN